MASPAPRVSSVPHIPHSSVIERFDSRGVRLPCYCTDCSNLRKAEQTSVASHTPKSITVPVPRPSTVPVINSTAISPPIPFHQLLSFDDPIMIAARKAQRDGEIARDARLAAEAEVAAAARRREEAIHAEARQAAEAERQLAAATELARRKANNVFNLLSLSDKNPREPRYRGRRTEMLKLMEQRRSNARKANLLRLANGPNEPNLLRFEPTKEGVEARESELKNIFNGGSRRKQRRSKKTRKANRR